MAQACVHCGQVHPVYAQVCPVTGLRLGPNLTRVSEDELLIGSVVADRWHVKDVIGQGLTGTVFAAEHIGFGRPAAMKVLRPRYASASVVQQVFHGEAPAAWNVCHPCLVDILDAGSLPDGAPFVVMERLEGETLATRLRRERLSTGAAVDVIMQILSAIDAIHHRELLLRDLRPQNVFLATRRGCRPLVKILDFGLARLIPLEGVRDEWDALRAASPDLDGPPALAVPYYLSPERARGEHGVERASDLFVAMVLFYESLTAERPFSGRSFDALLEAIVAAHHTRLSELRPDVPLELDALCARTLASNPRVRPPSARDLQDELRAVFDGPRRPSTSFRAVPAVAVPPPPLAMPFSFVDSSAHTPLRERPSRDEPRPPSAPSYATLSAEPAPGAPHTVASQQLLAGEPDPLEKLPSLYDDETGADRSLDEITKHAHDTRVMQDMRGLATGDEASADNPQRTVRPPSGIDTSGIDIVIEEDLAHYDDPATSRGQDIDAAMRSVQSLREDEETETMELTDEIRRRIEAMTALAAPAPVPAPGAGPAAGAAPAAPFDSSKPPPTRRLR